MRPEISDDIVSRLRDFMKSKHRVNRELGVRGYGGTTVEEALDELLKEVGY